MHLPIFYNPHIKFNFKQNWFERGIRVIGDVINALGMSMELNEFEELYNISQK